MHEKAKELFIYNTLSRTKERFEPLNPPYVGMYVCGPTVYNDVTWESRTFISFMIFRYLMMGYKVRYVRNITDAGHLEGDRTKETISSLQAKPGVRADGDAEVHPAFTRCCCSTPYHRSIEPTATGHILSTSRFIKRS